MTGSQSAVPIPVAQEMKEELEQSIQNLIEEFQETTRLQVSNVELVILNAATLGGVPVSRLLEVKMEVKL